MGGGEGIKILECAAAFIVVAVVSYALIRFIVRRATIGRPPLPPLAAFGEFGTPWGDVAYVPEGMRTAARKDGGEATSGQRSSVMGIETNQFKQTNPNNSTSNQPANRAGQEG